MADFFGDFLADSFGLEVGHEVGYESALLGRLEVADLLRPDDGGLDCLVNTLLFAGHHLAEVRSANLLGDLLAPGVGLLLVARGCADAWCEGSVADGLKPGLTDDLGLGFGSTVTGLGLWFVTFLHQRLHAGLECVVVANLLESDLASFPEVLLALLLLVGLELGNVSVMTLGHILSPIMIILKLPI